MSVTTEVNSGSLRRQRRRQAWRYLLYDYRFVLRGDLALSTLPMWGVYCGGQRRIRQSFGFFGLQVKLIGK
jgi:hypothetical protein